MDMAYFQRWIQAHDIEARSMSCFQRWFHDFKHTHRELLEDLADEFDENNLVVGIGYIELVLSNENGLQPTHISVKIFIEYKSFFIEKRASRLSVKMGSFTISSWGVIM